MSNEKAPGAAQAGHENSAAQMGSETVLDFLWSPETADQAVEQSPRHSLDPHLPAQSAAEAQRGVQDEASGEALEDALARYSSWLNSWGERELPD